MWISNVDSRLNKNHPQQDHPDLKGFHEQIQKNHQVINNHGNTKTNEFPQNSLLFKFLGRLTEKSSHFMSKPGKSLQFQK